MKHLTDRRLSGSALLCAFALAACSSPVFGADDREKDPLPLVVVKQVTINGRVFLLKDNDRYESTAANLRVDILTPDGERRLHRTRTDKDGAFAVPNLDVGRYQLAIGRLRLGLRVVEPDTKPGGTAHVIAKQILVYLPHSLAEDAAQN